MKTKFLLFFLLLGGFIFAQQNQEFKEIKNYFDQQKDYLQRELVIKYKNSNSEEAKISLKNQYLELTQMLDSLRNAAYIDVLIKVKNLEEINQLKISDSKFASSELKNNTIDEMPTFPNGIDALREKVASLFYTKGIDKKNKTVNTVVSFVVEKDGSISDVRASGEDVCLNKQAEIAMYLIPDKFSKPAIFKGNAVRYSFKMPLTIKFD